MQGNMSKPNSRLSKYVGILMTKKDLREKIFKLVVQYGEEYIENDSYKEGDVIPPSGKVIGSNELKMMTDAVLDGWLTTGRFNAEFEKKLGDYLGAKYVLTTNSGSSANLCAFTALTSPKLGERRLKPGDEVITVAAGFPTTVNPIIQNNCIPVFLDVDIPTYNINVDLLEEAYSDKTKAVMIAHTLGNPYNLRAIKKFIEKYNLWLVEDTCDALGSEYDGKRVGTFGDIGTLNFYPAHHITMGEGGAVFTNNAQLKMCIESIRDWGRDCYCLPGCDNTCGKRFDWRLGDLPKGYDHKYTYSHLGYNLKITDMQAACGLAQLERIDDFVKARKDNFEYLTEKMQSLKEFLILPESTENSSPSWFGFPITIKKDSGISRVMLIKHLDSYNIGTRLLFAGNLTRQPYFQDKKYRIVGNLKNSDIIMNHTFWIGLYPGLSSIQLDFVVEKLEELFGIGW